MKGNLGMENAILFEFQDSLDDSENCMLSFLILHSFSKFWVYSLIARVSGSQSSLKQNFFFTPNDPKVTRLSMVFLVTLGHTYFYFYSHIFFYFYNFTFLFYLTIQYPYLLPHL